MKVKRGLVRLGRNIFQTKHKMLVICKCTSGGCKYLPFVWVSRNWDTVTKKEIISQNKQLTTLDNYV